MRPSLKTREKADAYSVHDMDNNVLTNRPIFNMISAIYSESGVASNEAWDRRKTLAACRGGGLPLPPFNPSDFLPFPSCVEHMEIFNAMTGQFRKSRHSFWAWSSLADDQLVIADINCFSFTMTIPVTWYQAAKAGEGFTIITATTPSSLWHK